MKLLILAQKVDLGDPIFSFFHRWIIELARHFETITVICLYEGRHELPPHVRVFSLGKEKGASRLKYVVRFYAYIFKLRRDYDAVFVHQNQEYVLMGSIFWGLMRKGIYMWRNHYAGSFLTDVASHLCNKVFCTSKFSYTAKFKNTDIMPVGVDTEIFAPEASRESRQRHSILSLGRIAPSKKLDQLIEALGIIEKKMVQFNASIVGDALTEDTAYATSLKNRVAELGLGEHVSFKEGVPNDQTPAIYASHDIFVNLSPSGMFDKTIFEAMACGTLALSCNKNLIDKIDALYLFKEDDVAELASKLEHLLGLSTSERDARGLRLRNFAEENHGLSKLGSELALSMRSST